MRIGFMPLCKNVPQPKNGGWTKTYCSECGAACWESEELGKAKKSGIVHIAMCTECALKIALRQN